MTEPRGAEADLALPVAVSRPAVVDARALAALEDDEIAHLAEVMTRIWLRSNRTGWLFAVTPMVGCTAFIAASPSLFEAAFTAGFICFFAGNFISVLASRLSLRQLDLEVETLGYDKEGQKAVRHAYEHAIRSFRLHFGVDRKRKACSDALRALRAGSR